MRNVGGIAQTEAQKSSDLFMKCRYLDEITGIWHGELQHISGLDVRNLTEHLHQLWQVVELREPRLG